MHSFKISSAVLLVTLCSNALGQLGSCTSDSAVPIESLNLDEASGSGSGSGSSSGSGSNTNYNFPVNNDYNDFLTGLQDKTNDATNAGSDLLRNSVGKIRRRDLSCTATEYCLSAEKVPFCVNLETKDYRADGETGNFETGDFTLANGDKGNLYATAEASSAATPTAKGNAATASAASSTLTRQATGSATTATTAPARSGTATDGSRTTATVAPAQTTTAAGGANGLKAGIGGLVFAAMLGLTLA